MGHKAQVGATSGIFGMSSAQSRCEAQFPHLYRAWPRDLFYMSWVWLRRRNQTIKQPKIQKLDGKRFSKSSRTTKHTQSSHLNPCSRVGRKQACPTGQGPCSTLAKLAKCPRVAAKNRKIGNGYILKNTRVKLHLQAHC